MLSRILNRSRPNPTVSLVAVVAAVFLGALDQTVIVTVLPAVVVDLQIPFDRIDQAAWVVSGYLLGYTVSLPLMGRFSDLRGRRLSITIALVAFAVGSAGCAVAGSLLSLVLARVVQAAGGGALLPVAIAAVSDRYLTHRRALAIGLVGAVAEAGGVLGPLYGAAIVSWLTWRWIFWLNIPLALLLLGGTLLGTREEPRASGKLDLVGAAVIAVALGSLVVGLSHSAITLSQFDIRPILVGLAIVAIGGFGWIELHTDEPLIDLRLLRRHGYSAALVGGLVLGVSLIVAMVDVPLYAATVRGASASDGGLLLMRLTALIPVGAIVGGAVGGRSGLLVPTSIGFLAAGAGLALMSQWGSAPSETQLWLSLGLAGFGFGLLIAPLSTAAVTHGGVGREGTAAALFTVARLLGMTIGLSALTAWGLHRFDDLAGALPLPLPRVGETAVALQQRVTEYNVALVGAGAEVYREIFLAAAVVSLLGIGVAVWLRRGETGDPSAS
jgi:EmrB/QacA subfamily drug resistance transporter